MKNLINYIGGDIIIGIPYQTGIKPKRINKINLYEWSLIFIDLSTPNLNTETTRKIGAFIKSHLNITRIPDLKVLAKQLTICQGYRGASAHDQDAESRYDKEILELEQLRNLILGLEQQSILINIYNTIAKK